MLVFDAYLQYRQKIIFVVGAKINDTDVIVDFSPLRIFVGDGNAVSDEFVDFFVRQNRRERGSTFGDFANGVRERRFGKVRI